ncbi:MULTISPECIES: hypothetical protein [unclassified Endozoicomonas]|uniref:hypothetical protein n=1 Tax=unclassified Endozoicomonas TaxID=2644528 RepID=UPI003BB7F2DF
MNPTNTANNVGSSVFHAKLDEFIKSQPRSDPSFLQSRRNTLVENAEVLSKALLSRNIKGEENIKRFLDNDPDAPRFGPLSMFYEKALIAISQ